MARTHRGNRAVVLGLWISACGGGDDGAASGGSTGGGPASDTAPDGSGSGDASVSATMPTGSADASVSASTDDSGSGDASVSASATDDSGGGGELDACGQAPGQVLGPDMPWNRAIDAAALDPESDAIIAYLQDNVQSDARFQIDFSIVVLQADAATPRYAFEPTGDYFDPDCDPAPVPIPDGGHIEGESSYSCDNGGDCHLIVVDLESCRLYEQWRADFAGEGDYQGGCMALWQLEQAYDETLRGDYCSSADAGGFPISSMLFDADEVAAGTIRHALRFILPNDNIRADIFVRPGTHSTFPTAGPGDAPPYAVRLRLRADVDISGLNPAAQVVAQALQTYGMILADGGNITFTAESDDFTTAKWDMVGLGPHDMKDLQWSDFEVVDGGERIVWSEGDCTRTPIAD